MVARVLAAQLPVGTGGLDVVGASGRLEAVDVGAGRCDVVTDVLEAVAVVGVFDGVVDAVALLDAVSSGADDEFGDATTTVLVAVLLVLVAVTVAVLLAEQDATSSSDIPIAIRRMTQRSPLSQGCVDSIPGCGT
jgi:hypothetical protein